jgi:hypothetical protein
MCSKIVMCVKFKWLIRFKTLTNRLYHRCNVRIPSICTHLKTGGLSLFACFCGRHKIVLKVKFLLLKFSTISKACLSFIFTSFLKKIIFYSKIVKITMENSTAFCDTYPCPPSLVTFLNLQIIRILTKIV